MSYNFSSDKPIFLQMAELIKNDIISGKLQAGEKLKSVREFSMVYALNPNTVQKALAELEAEGLIYTDRTNGKFVAPDSKLISSSKATLINELTKKFVEDMTNLGISKKEIIKKVEEKING